MKSIVALALLCASSAIIGATGATVPQMFVQNAIPGDPKLLYSTVIFDSPFISSRDAQGHTHIGIRLPITATEIGGLEGIITIQYKDQPPQIFVDSGVVSYRVPVPTAPGPCPSKPGTAVFSADQTGAWYCVPNASGSFIWMKVSGSTSGW